MGASAKAAQVEVFVSFANGDKKSLRHKEVWKRLTTCLDALRVEGVIREWRSWAVDGDPPDASVMERLKRADIVIFALGQNYLDHPDRYREVMKGLPESGRYLVFSLLLYPSLWRNSQFERFNLLPSNKTPVLEWDDPEDVLMEIKEAIRQARRALYPEKAKPRLVKKDQSDQPPPSPPGSAESPARQPGSAPSPGFPPEAPGSFDFIVEPCDAPESRTEILIPRAPQAPPPAAAPPPPVARPAPPAPAASIDFSLPAPETTTTDSPGMPRTRRRKRPRETSELDSSPTLSAPELELERSRIVTDAARKTGPQPGGAQQDIVDCTVFAPPTAPRNSVIFVQVYAHLQEQAEAVIRMAGEFDSETRRRAVKSLEEPIARGTRLSFELMMPGLRVTDPVQTVVWRGKPEAAQFAVEIPGNCPLGPVIGSVTIAAQSVPFGHIKFKLQIAESGAGLPMNAAAGDEAKRYNLAFISYASVDRDKVLARVQMLNLIGIRYFQDVLTLDPGDRWEKEIYKNIDSCDLFLLFWSKAARDSEWVLKEVRYARGRQPAPEIKPVILEGPPVIAPPEDLNDLHFNDKFVYFMLDPKV